MKNETESSKKRINQPSACYAEEDLRRYLEDRMSENDMGLFDSHCDMCDHCAAEFWRQKISDKELYKKFLDKTHKLLNQNDKPKDFNMPRGFK